MDFEQSFHRHIFSVQLIDPGSTVIAAVSGGRDSMALLHVLRSLEKPMELTIYAGHVNHCLRESSDDDAAFVERKSNDLGIPFLYAELDPNKKKKSKSPEEWAREERNKALQEILKSINGDCIATAHHANDQAETVLFRLQQKSGIDGLRGIHEKRGNIIGILFALSCRLRDVILTFISKIIPSRLSKTRPIEIPKFREISFGIKS